MILFLAAGVALLFGLGSYETQHFEHKAAQDIAATLSGPRKHVEVHTRAVGLDALSGRFKRVAISASDFATPGLPLFTEPGQPRSGHIDELVIELSNFDLKTLHIERLSSAIPNCSFDFGLALRHEKIRLTKSGVGRGWVEIGQRDLEAFILRKFHDIKSVHVAIADGRVSVTGYGEFLALSTHFSVDAVLRPVRGTKIELADAAITFDGRPADDLSRQALLGVLNPVVDFDRDLSLYGAISVDKITLSNGELRAEGSTRIPDDPGVHN